MWPDIHENCSGIERCWASPTQCGPDLTNSGNMPRRPACWRTPSAPRATCRGGEDISLSGSAWVELVRRCRTGGEVRQLLRWAWGGGPILRRACSPTEGDLPRAVLDNLSMDRISIGRRGRGVAPQTRRSTRGSCPCFPSPSAPEVCWRPEPHHTWLRRFGIKCRRPHWSDCHGHIDQWVS